MSERPDHRDPRHDDPTRDPSRDPTARGEPERNRDHDRNRDESHKRAPDDSPRRKRRRRRRPSEPATAAATPDKPRRRHRIRRWTLRSAAVLVVVLLLIVLGVSIILRTTLPRRLVLSQLQQQFGLRITAASMDTTWSGLSTLKEVTLSLPLADQALLTVPTLRIDHTNLLALAFRRPMRIHDVELAAPHLRVQQDALGRWNITEAISLIARASSGGPQPGNGESSSGGAVQLPAITVTNGTVTLTDNDGRTTQLAPLEIHGTPTSPVAWSVRATAAPLLELNATIAPGTDWRHNASFTLSNPAVLKPFIPSLPDHIHLAGEWHGRFDAGGFQALADLRKGQVATTTFRGPIDITSANGVTTLSPRSITLDLPALPQTPIHITSGALTLDGSQVALKQFHLGLMGGTARVDGSYDWQSRSATLDAAWDRLILPGDITHRGAIQATLETPWIGRPLVSVHLDTAGQSIRGSWDTQIKVNASGPDWSHLTWEARLPKLSASFRDRRLDLTNLAFRLVSDGPTLALSDLRLDGTRHVAGEGQYDLRTRAWFANINLNQLTLPRVTRPVTLGLRASGNRERVDLTQLSWEAGKSNVLIDGAYIFDRPKPLDANLEFLRVPLHVTDVAQRPITRGALRGKLKANGTLLPMDVAIDGNLFGNDVYFGKRQLGNIRAALVGHVSPKRAELRTTRLNLLEGQWDIIARYLFEQDHASLDLSVANLSLKQLDALVDPPPDARGILRANLSFAWPHQANGSIQLTGDFSLEDFQKSAFQADSATGKVSLQGDDLLLHDTTLQLGAGRGTASLRYNLRNRTQLALELAAQNWPTPLPFSRGAMTLTGSTRLDYDIATRSATGPLNLTGQTTLDNQPLAFITLDSEFAGHQLRISTLRAQGFGGNLAGHGVVALNDWPRSTGSLAWTSLDSAAITRMWPRAAGLRGLWSGSLDIRHNDDPHSTEPLAASLHLRPTSAGFNGLDIQDADLTFAAGHQRIILSRSLWNLAGGQLNLWARLSRHDNLFLHTQLAMKNIQLNQVTRAINPNAREAIGQFTGEITLYGPPRDPRRAIGEASLRIANSDLLDFNVLELIYRTINPLAGDPPPRGRGVATFRLEQGVLTLINGFYRNQNIYARGGFRIENVFLGKDSPITGHAVGTARPLSTIELPLLPVITDVFAALQENFTTFRITGTAGSPRLEGAAFSDLNDDLRRVLLGDVEAEIRGSAGR